MFDDVYISDRKYTKVLPGPFSIFQTGPRNEANIHGGSILTWGMGITERFKALPMWLRCWKRRFEVSMQSGTNASQKVPADFAELLQDFHRSIIQDRKVHKIDPSDIIMQHKPDDGVL